MSRRLVVMVGMLLLAACEQADSPFPLVGTLERDRIEIPAQAWEVLLEIPVREAERVQPGQVLARQDPTLVESRLAEARATAERAARRLAELERGPRQEEITAARAQLEGAASRLAADEKELKRVRELVERRLLSDSDLDEATARQQVSAAERDRAAARLAELENGTTIEELDQARADLGAASAAVAQRSIELDRLVLRAPVAGTVDTIPYKTGDRPSPGATVMILLADTAPYARVYVPETVRALVVPGMDAIIRVDGVQETIPGRVRTVSSDAVFTPYFALTERDRSRLVYVAEVTLLGENRDRLPAGLPVEVDFPGLEGGAAGGGPGD